MENNNPNSENKPESTPSENQPKEKLQQRFPLPKILVAVILILVTLIAFGFIVYLMFGQNITHENQIFDNQETAIQISSSQRQVPSPNTCPNEIKKCKVYDEVRTRSGSNCLFSRCPEDPYFSPDKSRKIYIDYVYNAEEKNWFPTKYHLANANGSNDIVFYEDDPDPLTNVGAIINEDNENLWSPNGKYFLLQYFIDGAGGRYLIFKSDGTDFISGEQKINVDNKLFEEFKLYLKSFSWTENSDALIETYDKQKDGPTLLYNLETNTITKVD